MAKKKIGWGILGTGKIAKKLTSAIRESKTGTLVAVGSRTQAAADTFGKEFKVPNRYDSYDAVLADPKVQAVYISLPNHLHALWTIRCAEAGKAILCEKPLGMNFAEAMVMVEACRAAGVFLMEAFMYRCHPQTARLAELLRAKTIGDVRLIQSAFSYNMGPAYTNIRMQNAAGGGGIMDVGCYTASMSRLIAGAAMGKDFADPLDLRAVGHLGEVSRIDEWASAVVRFPGDITATLSCGTQVGVDPTVRIWGSEGNIQVPNPWFPGEKDNLIIVQRAGEKKAQTIKVDGGGGLYSIEVDTVAANLDKPQAPSPCMTWEDSLSNMRLLDQWRAQVGLAFGSEAAEAHTMQRTVAGRALARRKNHTMRYGRVPGLDKAVSRIVIGSMIFRLTEIPLTFAMLDHFVESGGNCVDMAWIYAGGQAEQAVGKWLKARGNRKDMVLLTKGGHTPVCDPANVTKQLLESLDRLGVEHVDLYCMHRDNPEIPVGEFVDVFNEHKAAGRITAFGGSNWTTQRIDEANEYAKSKGLAPMTLSSPNFSLATWNAPMWPGCITASDPASRAWHTQNQLPLFAWSSQAAGYFTGRLLAPDIASHPDWYVRDAAKVWVNDINRRKLERATELAAKKKTTATQIAMAYVLNQPFPTFALIGPRNIEEMRTTMLALGMELTEKERRWLNLEE